LYLTRGQRKKNIPTRSVQEMIAHFMLNKAESRKFL